ncbi:helix-turn-helix transcriptional regulator [Halalkalibacter oceani]|uniref:helix-turn-helix transcriptional regulator n=1 Tax=Halalkalibacter oceani TaxID=1653776 RepID=UPI0032E7F75F
MVVLGKETSSRQIILTMLKRNQEQTVADLAAELGVTEMAVRRHLQGLEKEGLIQARIERQAMGRPTNKYSLTKAGDECFPRNYGELSLGILQDLEKISGVEMIDQLFEQRRHRLEQQYGPEISGSFAERVAALARIQTENGYMVDYQELEDGSYEFKEYNCPIAKVAKEYPVACKCEHQLFQKLLGTEHVEQKTCIAKGKTSCCTYKLKERS